MTLQLAAVRCLSQEDASSARTLLDGLGEVVPELRYEYHTVLAFACHLDADTEGSHSQSYLAGKSYGAFYGENARCSREFLEAFKQLSDTAFASAVRGFNEQAKLPYEPTPPPSHL